MLKELQIKNFALIDDISVKFGKGLNILSGETGAGKTLIIEAINLLLGERADNELIREGSDKLIVQGYFDLTKSEKSIQFLKSENLIEEKEGFEDIVITREVSSQGKNRAFINGIFTQVSVLKNLGRCFIDLHGQHDHQSLLEPETHIDILDSFGKSEIFEIKKAYEEKYLYFVQAARDLEKLKKLQTEKELRLEELKFRQNEIEKLSLDENEEENLENEKNILKNYEKIYNACADSTAILNGNENIANSLTDNLAILHKDISELALIDKYFDKFLPELSSYKIFITDLNDYLKNYINNMEFSASRLDFIQERLFKIGEIKRKYNMELSQIKNYAKKIQDEILSYEGLDLEIEELFKKTGILKSDLENNAIALSEKREEAIKILKKDVKNELEDLNFKNAEFEIKKDYIALDNNALKLGVNGKYVKATKKGIDDVEFLLSFNPGESVKPLRKIASGGEISRIMLALKKIISGIDNIITMIFDEIDTGIGGSTAIIVGKKLYSISGRCQVICITHLPQIAAFADDHFVIDKTVEKERTKIMINRLPQGKVIKEIARMLSGLAESDISFKHAVELLEEAARIKKFDSKG
jgi:DNA repair protein RecN (Recombination protein N)